MITVRQTVASEADELAQIQEKAFACFEKADCRTDLIKPICYKDLQDTLDVIHKSFSTVAVEFGLTRENCPKHTSFLTMDNLLTYMQWRWCLR